MKMEEYIRGDTHIIPTNDQGKLAFYNKEGLYVIAPFLGNNVHVVIPEMSTFIKNLDAINGNKVLRRKSQYSATIITYDAHAYLAIIEPEYSPFAMIVKQWHLHGHIELLKNGAYMCIKQGFKFSDLPDPEQYQRSGRYKTPIIEKILNEECISQEMIKFKQMLRHNYMSQ